MKINLKVRLKSKSFWLTLIPALLVMIQAIAVPFGYRLNFDTLSDQLIAIVNAVFVVVGILGIANDPTTEGLSDSDKALGYSKPKKKGGK